MTIPVNRYWSLLRQYLTPQWQRVLWLAVLLLSLNGLRVINPQIIRGFIDAAMAGDILRQLLVAAGVFILLSLVIQALGIATVYLAESIGWTATNDLRADLMLHCLRLDMSFHHERTPGEMIERIDGDVVDLAVFFGQFAVRILGNVLLIVGVLLALYLEDWRVGLAVTAYALLSLYVLNRLRHLAVPYWRSAREAAADLFGFIEEHLAGAEDIRSSGAEEYTLRNLYRHDRERLVRERKAGVVHTWLVQALFGLGELGRITAFVVGFYLFTRQLVTLGTVYLITSYVAAIFQPLNEITNELQNMQKAGGSIERIEELYRLNSKIEDTGKQTLPSGPLALDFDHISFGYHDDHLILDDVSFRLEPGKVLGLLGRTGSGKTTMTRLLFRLYDATMGSICLNGVDARAIRLSELQSRVGIVTQEVQLFRATVRDNLTFFDSRIPDDRIMEVLADLTLMDWYRGLPHGLDTELESGGQGLSAGEGQLLAFTRIFLKNPGLVILDEASSRLDPLTEWRIEQAMDKLLQNRTGIIVAHRLATVRRADQILILEDGRVSEYGDYAVLAANPQSRLASLLRTGLEELLV